MRCGGCAEFCGPTVDALAVRGLHQRRFRRRGATAGLLHNRQAPHLVRIPRRISVQFQIPSRA